MQNIPIFLSSDDNYAPFVATTIASVCDNTKSFCDFYILDGGITDENKRKIEELKKRFDNFSINFISVSYDDLNNIVYKNYSTNVTIATYNRFLIPKFCKSDKCIYLDVDVILLGNIEDLYNIDLMGYPLGAVKDQYNEDFITKIKEKMQIDNLSPYFNAGVLLIDCSKWKNLEITQKLFDIDKCYKDSLTFADQDVLNKCFENNYLLLDKKFNVIVDNDEIVVRHFAGLIKPWQADFMLDDKNKPYKNKNVDCFWKYAAMTPFYEKICLIKERFLSSSMLWKHYNNMVNKGV